MKKVTTLGLIAFSSVAIFANAADERESKISVIQSAPVKVTKPLRELAKPLPKLSKERKHKLLVSGDFVPGQGSDREIPNRFPEKDRDYSQPKDFVDSVAQTSLKKSEFRRKAPDLGTSFDGLGNVTGSVPPDTNGDVGPNHYVQTVNVAMAIWDKEGNELLAPTAISDLWTDFGGICETNDNGDPIVLYDSAADRWLISQFAFDSGFTNNHQCIAISQTGDPTGAYFLYDFLYDNVKFNDYPHFGVWTDGYYMGVNQFSPNFSGGGVVAYERDAMLVGAPAQQVKFDMEGSTPEVFTPMPLDMDGTLPPPANAKQYFIWSDLTTLDNLQVWEFDVNWDSPELSTFVPVTAIDVTPYGSAPAITQPNGSSLDSLSIRSMFRAAYRNLDGQGKIVFTHNIAAPAGQGETALRWYEIDVDQVAGIATLAHEGTFAPDQESRWMGSGAMDVNGNVAFGYSIASPDMEPSIGAATRLATDPANTLTDEVMLHAGEASQSGASRWGDYSSLSVDPVDDCTFWFTTEYYKTANANSTGWSTRISSFKVPSCVAGPRGEITGTVTDASTGEPIPFATVSAGLASTKSDADGNYLVTLPVGDADVSATKYGWIASARSTVTVAEDETLTADIALDGAPVVVVSGTVADTSGTGNPLYAQVTVSVPGDTLSTYTNPETGVYSISLFEGTTVNFSASEIGVGGYLSSDFDLLPANETARLDQTGVDFDLRPNANCLAPGYDFVFPSFFEGFDTFPATGWTVVDDDGSGVVWSSFLASGRVIAGVESDAAFVDSDAGGFVNADTSLVSPVITVADLSTMTLEFDALFRTFSGADSLDVDVDVDGAGWRNIGSVDDTNTLDEYRFDLTADLAGATSFQVRFRYYDANFEWYVLVDNVRFGNRSCEPIVAGTLATGYIIDTNTGSALTGASVSIDGEVAASSIATPADEAVTDGLFQVFIPDSALAITVEQTNYETAAPELSGLTLATPVSMNAGQLEVDVTTVDSEITAGRSDSQSLAVSNTGSASADFSSFFVKGDPTSLINGPFHPSVRHFGPKNMNDLDTSKIRHFPETVIEPLAPGDIVGFFPTNITYGWGMSVNRNNGNFYIGDLAIAGAPADVIFEYDATGTLTSNSIPLSLGGDWFADSAFNQRTGMLWQVNVGGDNCIHEIDTTAMAATGNTICPAFGVSQRGLAYDPITDTFYSGSWTDSIVHQFTTDGTLIRSVNIGLSIAGLAFNAETNHLFISVNGASSDGEFDIVVADAASPDFVKVGGYDVRLDVDGDGVADDVINDNGQAGLDIDCSGNLWIVDQNQQFAVGFESGETGVCEWNNVAWLSVSETSASLAVDETSDIAVDFNAAGMTAGTYTASIVYANNTPYGSTSIPVTMTLNEPQFGTTEFAVTAIEAVEGEAAVITVERVGGSDFAVSVDFTTMNGSAMAGTDYTATTGTLTWDDLDTAAKTIQVPTSELDEHKSFTLVLSNAQGGSTIGAKSSMVVTIRDQPKGGGSFGFPLLALFAGLTFFVRRRATVK
jgi:hypothetical protein